MAKTLLLTCDVCEVDITHSRRFELKSISDFIPELNKTFYFCGVEHLKKFIDKIRVPKEEE